MSSSSSIVGRFPIKEYYEQGSTYVSQADWMVWLWQTAAATGGGTQQLTQATEACLMSMRNTIAKSEQEKLPPELQAKLDLNLQVLQEQAQKQRAGPSAPRSPPPRSRDKDVASIPIEIDEEDWEEFEKIIKAGDKCKITEALRDGSIKVRKMQRTG